MRVNHIVKKDNYYLEKCFSIAENYNVYIIQCEIREYDIYDIKKSVIEIKGTKENLQFFLKDFLITIEDIRNIEYKFH